LIRAEAPAEILVQGEKIGHVTSRGALWLPPGELELGLVTARGATARVKVTVHAGQKTEASADLPMIK
jgi:hypothetical protein